MILIEGIGNSCISLLDFLHDLGTGRRSSTKPAIGKLEMISYDLGNQSYSEGCKPLRCAMSTKHFRSLSSIRSRFRTHSDDQLWPPGGRQSGLMRAFANGSERFIQ